MGRSPNGEGKKRKLAQGVEGTNAAAEALVLDTFGGKLHVKVDHSGSATMLGQRPFFIELLHTSGLYERWIKSAPLTYSSPNAPRVEDVLGTLFLAARSGMRRYSHINGLRADGASPGFLGMNKIVSDDSLSRALGAMDEVRAQAWLSSPFGHFFRAPRHPPHAACRLVRHGLGGNGPRPPRIHAAFRPSS